MRGALAVCVSEQFLRLFGAAKRHCIAFVDGRNKRIDPRLAELRGQFRQLTGAAIEALETFVAIGE